MSQYVINGGKTLKGEVLISGNKNAALPCIAATLLSDEKITLRNIPDILDVSVMLKLSQELGSEIKRVDKNTLVKICLLHQLAKAIRLIPNDNSWEIEKRGLIYKYNSDLPSIRTGLHSLIMCQVCGINFSTEEAEAMTVNDRDLTDDQARWHSSIMASIIRQASELTYLTLNDRK